MRTIKIVEPATASVRRVESEATQWGELATEIKDFYNLNKVKATVKETKGTLEHHEAVLPEGEFTIFLRASKNKAGVDFLACSFKDLRAYIKETEGVKDYLKENKIDGRNWTQFSIEELKESLIKFASGTATEKTAEAKPVEKEEESKEAPTEVKKTPVSEEKEEEVNTTEVEEVETTAVIETLSADIENLSTEQKIDLISTLSQKIIEDFIDGTSTLGVTQEDCSVVTEHVEQIEDNLVSILVYVSRYTEIENKDAIKKAKEQQEDEDLLSEAKSFASEMN